MPARPPVLTGYALQKAKKEQLAKDKREKAERQRSAMKQKAKDWGSKLEDRYGITQDFLVGPSGADEIRIQVQPFPDTSPDMWLTMVCWRPSTVAKVLTYLKSFSGRQDRLLGGFQLDAFLDDQRIQHFEWAAEFNFEAMLESVSACEPSSDLFQTIQSHFEAPWVVLGNPGLKAFDSASFPLDSTEWTKCASGGTLWEALWALGRCDSTVQWGFHSATGQHLAGSVWHVDQV